MFSLKIMRKLEIIIKKKVVVAREKKNKIKKNTECEDKKILRAATYCNITNLELKLITDFCQFF